MGGRVEAIPPEDAGGSWSAPGLSAGTDGVGVPAFPESPLRGGALLARSDANSTRAGVHVLRAPAMSASDGGTSTFGPGQRLDHAHRRRDGDVIVVPDVSVPDISES